MRKNSKPEKCLKTAQTPTRRLHALLGNLPSRTTAEKRHHRQHDKILHATLIFTRANKNCDLPKRLLQKRISPNKTTNEPKRRFWKT
jgi:hypothetical protein